MMIGYCVCCGAFLDLGQDCLVTSVFYCSVRCAERQLQTLGTLLHSTPRSAMSVEDWHDLSAEYHRDLLALEHYHPHATHRESLAVGLP